MSVTDDRRPEQGNFHYPAKYVLPNPEILMASALIA